MPVKDKSVYAEDWEQISYRIRLRANDKCEECGVSNGELIHRCKEDLEQYVTALEYKRLPAWKQGYYRAAAIRVVLTCAHLDNDVINNRGDNLKALCQLHHLRHDAAYHAQNAKKTRQAKGAAQIAQSGQLGLFDAETPPTPVLARPDANFAEVADGD